MKMLTIVMILFFSFSAISSSEGISIILDSKNQPLRAGNLKFKVDKSELGRAWITLDVIYNDFDNYIYKTVRTKVPELFHDVKAQEVLLNGELCATTKKVLRRRFLRKPVEIIKVESTNQCHFDVNIIRKEVVIDDGYDVIKEKRFVVEVTLR